MVKLRWIVLLVCFSLLNVGLALPAFGQSETPVYRQIPAEVVWQVAAQVLAGVNQAGQIPDTFALSYGEGPTEQISAAQALGLLASAGECLRQGKSSATLALFSPQISPPVIAGEAASNSNDLLFATGELLAPAQGILDFTYVMKAYPNAVWVGQKRIASGDYLAALAALLQFTLENKQLPSQVQVLAYMPPSSWRSQTASSPTAATTSAIPPMRMVGSISAAPVSLPSPTLEIFPKEGAKLAGPVNVVAALKPEGTYANVTFSVDEKSLLHSNWPPYVLALDATTLAPGQHKIKVEAFDSSGKAIASKEITVTVTGNPASLPAEQAGDAAQN